nr:hypothetical protein [Brevundimonas sp.]
MLANIRATGQDAVHLTDAPAPAVASEEATAVQVRDDGLDAHLAGGAVALKRKPIHQPHSVGVERIDLQHLLDLGPPRLGRDDAVTERRAGAVPESLTSVLLQGAGDVLAILLGLILIEQRHDLAHHDAHPDRQGGRQIATIPQSSGAPHRLSTTALR